MHSAFLTYMCPCIASISLKYNQQDATFSRSIYLYKLLYMFQAVPPPIIRSIKLRTASGIFKPILLPAAIVDGMELSSISSTIAAVLVWQYLTLYIQFCAPDDGRRNCLKHVRQFIDEMPWRYISSTIAGGSSIGLTIPDAVFTVLCSWWWAEEPPETCTAIYSNK